MSTTQQALEQLAAQSPKRLVVYSVKSTPAGSVWVRVGTAWTNRDGSLNVTLDVLPLDGRLHLRRDDRAKDAAEG